MDDVLKFAQAVFAAQPFSQFIGAQLHSVGPNSAEIWLPLRDELNQQHGFAHGGVISYLADNAITFAGGIALGGNALTSEFKINYVKPGTGEKLIARATTKSVGKRQAVCLCEVFAVDEGGKETLCALAQGTIVSAR